MAGEPPPFVKSQGIRILLETDDPRPFLHPLYFRNRRNQGGLDDPFVYDEKWESITRRRLLELIGSTDGLRRMVFTTDAGIGKTTNMQWLCAKLNQRGRGIVAFLVSVNQLPIHADGLLTDTLLPLLRDSNGNGATSLRQDKGERLLRRLREQGRLVLLFDALDQSTGGARIETLRRIVNDSVWQSCTVIISGRPHALQRHWTTLFAEPSAKWRFLQLDEFDEGEQRFFLGEDEHCRDRYDAIPAEAREILSVPRVLKYLRDLPPNKFPDIRTPSDVYWQAIKHMIKEGMRHSERARQLGLSDKEETPTRVQQRSLRRARKLLGAIAFEMTSSLVPRRGLDGTTIDYVPNFDQVGPGEFDELVTKVSARVTSGNVERDVDCLGALHAILSHGFFDLDDADIEGLDRILWRNRTLQEFFTACWLSQHCSPEDAGKLAAWIYQPENPLSEEYYWVWRFVCEMPEEARHPKAWVRSVSPLYVPSDKCLKSSKRSNEMIFRSWDTIQKYAEDLHSGARQVLFGTEDSPGFLREFEQILSGKRGEDAQRLAVSLQNSFVTIESGTFQMGSPPEKQVLSPELEKMWTTLDRTGIDTESIKEHVRAGFKYPPGRRGEHFTKSLERICSVVADDFDVTSIERLLSSANETPSESNQGVECFLLGLSPVTNDWYRLFVPEHGLVDSYYCAEYEHLSPTPDCPVVFVTWYDAWVFSKWARWNGRSCRLPLEYEWEYAAKAGTRWDWNYWWGDEFDDRRCNANRKVRRTTPPNDNHKNPWDVLDILGNVWEWCEDGRRDSYSRYTMSDTSARALRGGSWDSFPSGVRSAFREFGPPMFANGYRGFRLTRSIDRDSVL